MVERCSYLTDFLRACRRGEVPCGRGETFLSRCVSIIGTTETALPQSTIEIECMLRKERPKCFLQLAWVGSAERL